ncbi:MAG: hypothetical protein ABEH38_01065 [Flavobacteriales bacterium]
MTKMTSLRSIPLSVSSLFLIVVLACSTGPYSGAGEPNDRILEASLLKDGKPIKMKIDSMNDRDWYGIELGGDGYVSLATQKVPDGLKLEARFARKKAWEAEKRKWLSKWQELPVAQAIRGVDTVHFVIRAKAGKDPKNAFKLRARAIAEFDEHEPNNKGEEAASLELGQKLRSYVYPLGDRDYFKVNVDRSGYLFAKPKKVPEKLGAEVRFLTMNQAQERLLPISGYRKIPAGASVNESGTYYVEFGDDHNNASSEEPVDWKLEFVSQMDSTEPNARWMDAHPIRVGDTMKIALFPAGDRDIFQLNTERSMTVKVSPEGVKGLTPQVQLIQESKMSSSTMATWRSLPDTFSIKGGKKHFMILREKEDDKGDRSPFLLGVSEFQQGPS